MTNKALKKLEDDARYEAESWTFAHERVVIAKRALEDMARAAEVAKNKTFTAIKALADYRPAEPTGGADK